MGISIANKKEVVRIRVVTNRKDIDTTVVTAGIAVTVVIVLTVANEIILMDVIGKCMSIVSRFSDFHPPE